MTDPKTDPNEFRPYLKLDSGGIFTNLQLYSLQQAVRYWRELEVDLDQGGNDPERVKERCVFAVAALGLSLSQLLGQNNPRPKEGWVDAPAEILEALVEDRALDSRLVDRFSKVRRFYDAARHFGQTIDGSKHQVVDELTVAAASECFEVGRDVWLAVLSIAGKEPGRELAELFENEDFPTEHVIFHEPREHEEHEEW